MYTRAEAIKKMRCKERECPFLDEKGYYTFCTVLRTNNFCLKKDNIMKKQLNSMIETQQELRDKLDQCKDEGQKQRAYKILVEMELSHFYLISERYGFCGMPCLAEC